MINFIVLTSDAGAFTRLENSLAKQTNRRFRKLQATKEDCAFATCNKLAASASGELIIPILFDLHLADEFVERIHAILQENLGACCYMPAYTNLGSDDLCITYAHPFDLSEQTHIGQLWILSRNIFLEVGGFRTDRNIGHHYDLKLRLYSAGNPVALRGAPLYHLPSQTRESALNTVAPAGGWPRSDPREQVFREDIENYLQRNNAWLDTPLQSTPAWNNSGSTVQVSVVIPVFNSERPLAAAISSVLTGSFQDYELLLIIDPSTSDQSETVARGFLSDHRIRILHSERPGISAALNCGIQAARGRFVVRLDSDDLFMPSTLERLVISMGRSPRWAMATSYYQVFHDTDDANLEGDVIRHDNYSATNLLRLDGIGQANIWRRDVFMHVGLFDEALPYGEDYDMALRVSEQFEIGRVREVLYRYRVHDGSISHRMPLEERFLNKSSVRQRAVLRRQAIRRAIMKESTR